MTKPLSFAVEHRRHGLRPVITETVPLPGAPVGSTPWYDPFEALPDDHFAIPDEEGA
ncbi:hypothetical protein [Streptomyces sp. NPDC005435]|uniref:hypothetical protein n=1 Tax=Streptomyces sp. NPDC005435 TaxID=3154464 RepID=UPI003451C1EC